MFKSYLKIALRNILRYKGYSIISIGGLAIGMAVFIVIVFFVRYEFSFDTFNVNFDRVYRVEELYKSNRAFGQFPLTPAPLAPTLVRGYPGIIDSTRIVKIGRRLLSTVQGDKKIHRDDGKYADASFFNIFSFPLIKGDRETVLSEPYSMVLTEELAETYFPNDDPLGKTIRIFEQFDCKVTGVAKKVPKNSHIKFDYLVSLSTFGSERLEDWDHELAYSYILTQKEHSYKRINGKIEDLLMKNRKGERANDNVQLYLKPLSRVHHSNTNYELESSIPVEMLYVVLTIGIIILLISCINFINLATAYSSIRGKEVGVRKVLGAARFSLIEQYLSESVLLSFISFAIAWVLAELSIPEFNRLLNTEVGINLFEHWQFILSLGVFVFFVGVFSGSYPAFLLSSFHPVKVLKGTLSSGGKVPVLRKIMVTAQFLFCIIFIIFNIVFFKLGSHVKNMDKGFSENNICVQRFDNLSNKSIDKFVVLKEQLLKHPAVLNAAFSGNLPSVIYNDLKVDWEGGRVDEHIWITYTRVDKDFMDTYDIELVQGRKFPTEFSTGRENFCIINEKALRMFGWNSSPIGKRIAGDKYEVIGVVKDFCSSDMRLGIKPLMLLPYRDSRVGGFYFSIKFAPGSYPGILDFIKQKFAEVLPDEACEFILFQDIMARNFSEFDNWNKLIAYFSILSILLAASGLYAIASFSTQRRTKEIGIRKTIGASVSKILVLLFKDFFKLIVIATLAAWPIGYIMMSNFLRQFAFRIDMQIWMFLFSALLVFGVAVVTVGYHTIKTAYTNPVEALRYE